jgi:hypothetical protein
MATHPFRVAAFIDSIACVDAADAFVDERGDVAFFPFVAPVLAPCFFGVAAAAVASGATAFAAFEDAPPILCVEMRWEGEDGAMVFVFM